MFSIDTARDVGVSFFPTQGIKILSLYWPLLAAWDGGCIGPLLHPLIKMKVEFPLLGVVGTWIFLWCSLE
jgi:hypothetical protein